MDDVKAPERVYGFLEPDQGGMRWEFSTHPDEADTEYVRADLHDALTKERDEAEDELLQYRTKWLAQSKRANQAEAEVERLREALIWCSGSDDFQESGKARAGWLKLCAPLLKALQRKEGDE